MSFNQKKTTFFEKNRTTVEFFLAFDQDLLIKNRSAYLYTSYIPRCQNGHYFVDIHIMLSIIQEIIQQDPTERTSKP